MLWARRVLKLCWSPGFSSGGKEERWGEHRECSIRRRMGGEAELGVPSSPHASGSQPCQPRLEQPTGRKREAPSIRQLHPHPRSGFQQEKIPEPVALSFRAQGQQNKGSAAPCAAELASCPGRGCAWGQRGWGMFRGPHAVLPTARLSSAAWEGRYRSPSTPGSQSKRAFVNPGVRWLLLSCT